MSTPPATPLTEPEAKARKAVGVLPGIQLLRGMAALFVVIGHCNALFGLPEYLGRSPLPYLEEAGGFSVAVFFVISGFIICVAALDTSGRAKMSAAEFARRRFVRIIPFLWVCVIGYNLLSFIGTHRVEWMPAIRAMTLWPIGDLKPNVIWSLRHEALFYLLFALAYLSPWKLRWPLLLWFVSPILLWLPAQYFRPWLATHPLLAEAQYFFLLGSRNGGNCQFACGVAMGLAWLRGGRFLHMKAAGGLIPAALTMTAVTAIVVLTGPPAAVPFLPIGPDRPLPSMLLWTGLAALAGWVGIVSASRHGLFDRVAMILGDASYSIYLVHNAVLLVVIAAAKKLHVPVAEQMPLLLLLVGGIVSAVLGGIVVHLFVEKPLIRALTPRRKQAALPVGIGQDSAVSA